MARRTSAVGMIPEASMDEYEEYPDRGSFAGADFGGQSSGNAIIRMPLTRLDELGGGARQGGRFVGPKTDTGALVKGRPPMDANGVGPMGLSISFRSESGTAGQTCTINAEVGCPDGGLARRIFQVGEGLSAELHVGSYPHVNIRMVTSLPANCFLYWTWVYDDTFGRSRLLSFVDYPVAAVSTDLPEGTEFITPQNACVLTFQITQFATTFTKAVVAGERVSALWGAFSCNVINKFIVDMRGL